MHKILTKAEDWAIQAASLPLAFSQTREDAHLDLTALRLLKSGADVLMVASGGCTVASLAGSGLARSIHAVDINPAQIALTKFKLRLLQYEEPETRLTLLGHERAESEVRQKAIIDFCRRHDLLSSVFGDLDFVGASGLDHCGRFEQLFKQLQDELQKVDLKLETPPSVSSAQDKEILYAALEPAFARVFAQANLVELFGESATNNRVISFDRHFLERIVQGLVRSPLSTNPYLQQILLGRFIGESRTPWLYLPPAESLPQVRFSTLGMHEALAEKSEAYDLVHLSNVLDWLDEAACRGVFESAYQALRPGGLILARQLNSNLDYKTISANLPINWLDGTASRLRASDRSCLYRSIYIGRK